MMKKKLTFLFLLVVALLMLFPVFYMVKNSFIYENVPDFSLMAYYRILFSEPQYLLKFWKSLGMSLVIAFGQTLIGCMGGVAFAKYRFRGQKIWFGLMLLFMLLPVQVTLLPNYIVLDKLEFLNTYKALIIPGLFAPFGVIWMSLIFRTMPNDWLDAASLDGAGKLRTLFSVLMPAGKAGVVSLFVLSFVDSWNMVEQPMVFLQEERQYPLSVFLAGMSGNEFSLQYVCGILSMIPVSLLFLYFQEELMEGIAGSVGR